MKLKIKIKVKKIQNKKAQKYFVFRQVVLCRNFPFLTNKKIIKPRRNIFKINSVVSTKLSSDSSFNEQIKRDSPFVETDGDPVLLLCLISTTSTLLVKFGILEYLSNNSSNELLMIGIGLVKNSAKPTIFGTGDLDEPLKSSSFNCLSSPLSKCNHL